MTSSSTGYDRESTKAGEGEGTLAAWWCAESFCVCVCMCVCVCVCAWAWLGLASYLFFFLSLLVIAGSRGHDFEWPHLASR